MRGSIQKRGASYRIVVDAGADPVTGKRRQITRTGFPSRKHAQHALNRLLVEVGNGAHGGHDTTVAELIEARMAAAQHLGVSTRRDYRSAIDRHIPATLARTPIWKVRARDLDNLYAALTAAGLGAPRVRRVHSILSASFAQAVKWGWLARNPATDASPPVVERRPPSPPSAAEVRMLLGADSELAIWLRLEAGLGARRGEVCALRWSDLDLDAGTAVIRRSLADGGRGIRIVAKGTKTNRERSVALDEASIATLRAHRARAAERALAFGVHLQPDAWVFSTDAEGMVPWRPDRVTKRFIVLRRALSVGDHVKLKDLRHFVATQLLAAGVDPRTVANRLGHARTSTTLDIYAGVVPARDRDAAELLGRLLG